eukprot:1286098-Pyramimonas_sp.AAC.1
MPPEAKILNVPIVVGTVLPSRLLGLPTLQDGRRLPQDRPRTAHQASKRVPRRPREPQDGPRGAQASPRGPQARPKRGPKHGKKP